MEPENYNHDITTQDDVPLDELVETLRNRIDHFNDMDRPFRSMFVEQMGTQSFEYLADDEGRAWTELAETEHPETIDIGEGDHFYFQTQKFGQALHMTQERIQREPADRITRRVDTMLAGFVEKQQNDIYDTLFNGIADGTKEVPYPVDSMGEYSFTQSHKHKFTGTNELFASEGMDHPYNDENAQSARRHLRMLSDHLRHHDRGGPYVAMVGPKFATRLKDEMDLGTQSYLPEARNLIAQSVWDLDVVVEDVRLMHTPWVSGDNVLLTQVNNNKPVKYFEEFPLRYQGPNGAPIRSPGDIIGAYGSCNYGMGMVDPLAAVLFEPENDNENFA